MNEAKTNLPATEPVLFLTHNDLKEVLNNTDRLICRIRNSSALLHPFPENGPCQPSKDTSPEGIVAHFKDEIARANALNEDLKIIASHLETVIGS